MRGLLRSPQAEKAPKALPRIVRKVRMRRETRAAIGIGTRIGTAMIGRGIGGGAGMGITTQIDTKTMG